MKLIKDVATIILPVLVHIYNSSFTSGIFLDDLKIARVTPIYKAGDKREFKNHRPVSVLNSFSKILEKLMSNRVHDFCQNYNIFIPEQYGFRMDKSTELALISFTNDVLTSFDRRTYTVATFLDLSKAFDTVDHEILSHKLEHYGISFQSFLSNRKQFVQYKNTSSKTLSIVYGVPQGSILGPLLFLLYVNDVTHSSPLSKFILFADDCTLYKSNTDLPLLISQMNQELFLLGKWIRSNKPALNIDKTNYIIFHRNKHMPANLEYLRINRAVIKQVFSTRFLGVIVDDKISWSMHIKTVCNKVNKMCGIMQLTSHLLTKEARRHVYHTLLYPSITYCNTVWAKVPTSNTKSLIIAQKRAVQIIAGKSRNEHTNDLVFTF